MMLAIRSCVFLTRLKQSFFQSKNTKNNMKANEGRVPYTSRMHSTKEGGRGDPTTTRRMLRAEHCRNARLVRT